MPTPISVRDAVLSDADIVSSLLDGAKWRHLHSDWFQPVELLGSKPFKLAFVHQSPVGCLACPPDPPSVAWLRMFTASAGFPEETIWEALWPPVERQAAAMGVKLSAVMLTGKWMQPLLTRSGFHLANEVIFLEWFDSFLPEISITEGEIRRMHPSDVAAVAAVDSAAFPPLWQHSAGTLREALRQAAYAAIVERNGEILGYQITTISTLGAHLARLAVHPSAQGRGFGTLLVANCVQTVLEKGINRLTVNTQSDNHISRKLYAALGFLETGVHYPIFRRAIG